ncbi:MAG: hypothetical protein AMXMBFR7_16460 [Planctomycetota bacterium]
MACGPEEEPNPTDVKPEDAKPPSDGFLTMLGEACLVELLISAGFLIALVLLLKAC